MSTKIQYSNSFKLEIEGALKKLLQENGAQLTCEVFGVPEGVSIGLTYSIQSSKGETMMELATIKGLTDRSTVSLGNLEEAFTFSGKPNEGVV